MEDVFTNLAPDLAREGGTLVIMWLMIKYLLTQNEKTVAKVEALELAGADTSDELRLTLIEKQVDKLEKSCGQDHDAFVEHRALVTSQLQGIWGKVGDRPTDRCNKTGG